VRHNERVLAVDKYGRAITIPEEEPLPEGAEKVDREIWDKIRAGAPRVFTKTVDSRDMMTVSRGGTTWAPTYNPGDNWFEVTDQEEIDRILKDRETDGDHET